VLALLSHVLQPMPNVPRTFGKGRDDDLDGESPRFGDQRQVGESVNSGC
jgi:hypothetical protein